ncbi:3-hydroxyacyl-CoA dehydrogenase [Gordonia defluvii]|jgi:3-hydroxybutyryl-CoA dehydrogenase|uniref:3-hydroxyacyl-CoA dehydrogenase n=1 Tax=Gordonia defluvii TaxID=283718 RepID=A0ABP6LFA1_9ACTN|nr:3-hydroxyacyl-CoA dehydrogenase [Gordonia sp. UBA5067]
MTSMTNVAVFGTGVLGSQIAMQAAYHGKRVIAYDVSQELLDKLPARWEWMRAGYQRDLADFDADRFDRAIASITATTSLQSAVEDADIVIEAIPENLDLKKKVWASIGAAAPPKTVFTTNSSSLRPSDFADATGRPAKFLALHFANIVWSHNTGEVMPTPQTDPAVFEAVLSFATEIGLVAIPVRNETPGYLLNSLLIPFLNAAAYLYVDEVADPVDIDTDWKIATGSPQGPFEVYDLVGFNVAINIMRNNPDDERLQRFADMLEKSAKEGRSGLSDGAGFYEYDATGQSQGMAPRWKLG